MIQIVCTVTIVTYPQYSSSQHVEADQGDGQEDEEPAGGAVGPHNVCDGRKSPGHSLYQVIRRVTHRQGAGGS